MSGIKSEYNEPKPQRPFFYNDKDFIRQKIKEFNVQELIDVIRRSKEDRDKVKDMNDNQMVEMLYHDAIILTWKNIMSIEASSGKRMNGLMMYFSTDTPEIELNIMGAKEKAPHSQKENSDIGMHLFSFCTFIPLQDIIKYAIDDNKIQPEQFLDAVNPENGMADFDLLSSIMDIVRTIIADNNPLSVTFCIDSVVVQETVQQKTGERRREDIKYHMNYTEFPNGKCVKSVYRLLPVGSRNTKDAEHRAILKKIDVHVGGNTKAIPVAVSDILLSDKNLTIEEIEKNPKMKDLHTAWKVFEDYSAHKQIKKLIETGSIGLICDDVFDSTTNKHDQLNGHAFYLYRNKDVAIYEKSQVNPEHDIKNFLDTL